MTHGEYLLQVHEKLVERLAEVLIGFLWSTFFKIRKALI